MTLKVGDNQVTDNSTVCYPELFVLENCHCICVPYFLLIKLELCTVAKHVNQSKEKHIPCHMP